MNRRQQREQSVRMTNDECDSCQTFVIREFVIRHLLRSLCYLLFRFLFCMDQSDSNTTVAELRKLVADFVAERDWSQFHSPQHVSMALAIEAAELMEHFQWLTTDASRELAADPNKLAEVGEELADVIGYSFALANELGLDISSAIRAKMVKNAEKYPAEKYRGRYERPKT